MRASSVSSPAVSASVVRYGGKANAGAVTNSAISRRPRQLPDFNLEPVEIGDAVCFRPKTHAARLRECRIDDLEQGFAVECDAETSVIERHAQSAPLLRGYRMLDAVVVCAANRSQWRTPAVLHLVQH